MKKILPFLLIAAALLSSEIAAAKDINLPAPDKKGGKPLMECLSKRMTRRNFSSRKLPQQLLSDLLWAAWGINRPNGKRTAPSALNKQDISLFVVMHKGLYLYDPVDHKLIQKKSGDLRQFCGIQEFHKIAPVVLVYVSDLNKFGKGGAEHAKFYAAVDTGYISQNVYLFAASNDLATVVCGWLDRNQLAEKMGLPEHMKVLLSQPVGYPGAL
ncbi:SagB/ThcOx family dehydrogenase [Lentisphaerota bacterium ZTH]|nr:SagB/ThcOx family dehydrogenase [Lentisphaerota bacterium]WET07170.1 SagB/ThcOx family dehydrogenase [Lentisphaerota bacterium ZTH]